MLPKPRLNAHQLDVIKYASLTDTSIVDLRNNLVDECNRSVFDYPVVFNTKYLNKVALSNTRRALDKFRRNPNGKSKYRPLAVGYSVYHAYYSAPGSTTRFPDIDRGLYESQFCQPQDKFHNESMVGFSHLHNVRHHAGFSSPSASTLHSVPSTNRTTGVNHAPLASAAFSSLATKVDVRTDSSEPNPTQVFQFNVNIHGQTCDYYTKMEFGQNGLSYAGFPGGGGIEAFYGSNLITVNDVKHNALLVNVSTSLPVNNAMPFTTLAEVVSSDTVIVPIISGINPELADKMMEQLSCEEHRIGTKLDNVFDVLRAFKAASQARGFTTKKLAITFKGLPHQLSNQGMLQDDVTLKVNPRGLTATVCSNQFRCKDNLDDEGGVTYFNGTGNFYVVPVVAPDLQLVTKEVPKDHVQVMLEKRKARTAKHRTEDTEVRSLNAEFGHLDVKSISAASLSPYNSQVRTPLSSSDNAASNQALREQTTAKFKKFVKANPMLKGHNLVFVEGDGNCAPRSMAVHIYGSEGLWTQAKALVADYAVKNFRELTVLIGITDNEIIKMATDGAWQSEVFFKVAALRFDVDIVVFAFGGEDRVYQANGRAKNTLKLFFSNGHFCPIVKRPNVNRRHMPTYIDDEFSSEDEHPGRLMKSKHAQKSKRCTYKPIKKHRMDTYTTKSRRSLHKYKSSSSSSESESSDNSKTSNKTESSNESKSSNAYSTSFSSESSDESETTDASAHKPKRKSKPEESETDESKSGGPEESEPEEPEESEPEEPKESKSNAKSFYFTEKNDSNKLASSNASLPGSTMKLTLPGSTSKPTVTPNKLVPALKTPTGSAGKKISDTLVSFFGGLTSSTYDGRGLEENGSVTVEFDHDESSFKKEVEEVQVENVRNVKDELAGGKQNKTDNEKKKTVEDNSTSSDKEDSPKKKSGKKKTVAVDSDEDSAGRKKKHSGKKKTAAVRGDEQDSSVKKTRGRKKKIAVDSDEEDGSKNTKSGKKMKETEPYRRSRRQTAARTKKSN